MFANSSRRNSTHVSVSDRNGAEESGGGQVDRRPMRPTWKEVVSHAGSPRVDRATDRPRDGGRVPRDDADESWAEDGIPDGGTESANGHDAGWER